MDIRAFFQKKSGSDGAKAPTKAKSTSSKASKAASTATAVKAATKKPVATKADSKAPATKSTKHVVVVDDDSDDDIVEVQPPQRKRTRQVVKEEEEEEDEVELVAPPIKVIKKASSTKAKATETIKKEETKEIKDEEDATPLQMLAGKPPAPCSGCLEGKTFVFSGVLHNLSREDVVHLVKKCGGMVATNVTRTTKYVVVGHTLENGDDVMKSSKYKDAIQKNVRILHQNEFYNLITEATARKQVEQLEKEKSTIKSSTKSKHKVQSNACSDMLLTDKYKPTKLDEMIGNIELGKKLKQWLVDFEAVHVKKTKKVPFNPKLGENRGAKTVLLSGPPGIGKTTIATLVAKECGFECTELNASDTRSKKMLQTGLQDVLGTQALQFGGSNAKSKVHLARRVVIMDEVDGMSGGDRGGTAELIQLIKKSKTPIICICNDRQSTKVRSLANHAFDLRMRRPTKTQIGKRLMEIGRLEGLDIEKNAIEEAAERCGNDIRQLLTQMQQWRRTKTKITYADIVDPLSQHSNKDHVLRLNPFSATQQIFQRDQSFDARNEAYFVDYDLMPLMVQENYMQSIMSNRTSADDKMEAAVHAADFIAESDLVNTYVRMDQRWDLLTKQGALNVAACVYASGFIGHPEFSRWLGKNSSASKSKRLLSELSVRMRAHASGSREVIRLDYVPYMKEILLQRLLSGEEQIDEVIELLDACEITREDLTESMESFKFPGIKRHSYAELDTKSKTSFTRKYNKGVHKAQGVVESTLGGAIKKGRSKATPVDDDSGLAPPSDAEEVQDKEDDDEDVDITQFQKKPRATTKRKAAATTKTPAKAPAKRRRA